MAAEAAKVEEQANVAEEAKAADEAVEQVYAQRSQLHASRCDGSPRTSD